MTSDVRTPLGTEEGRRSVVTDVSARIRRRDYDGAEALLVGPLTTSPGPIATACRGLVPDDVELVGWEEVAASLGRATAAGRPATAVGLDLSNFSDSDGRDWWDKDLVVEVSLYDDTFFPFSTATRRETQRAAEAHPAPWTGRRLPGVQAVIDVRGLRAINGALLRHEAERPWTFGPDGRSYGDHKAALLGGWWLVMRFHEAVARVWPEVGLALGVPVLVGQHGVGPWCVSVFTPEDAVPVPLWR